MANPFELEQALQSAVTVPLGNVTDAQLTHVRPMMTLPAGQRHFAADELHTNPLKQMQPKALAKPFERGKELQSVQKPSLATTKFWV